MSLVTNVVHVTTVVVCVSLLSQAKTPEDAEEGWYLMQDIMKMMSANQNQGSCQYASSAGPWVGVGGEWTRPHNVTGFDEFLVPQMAILNEMPNW